MALPADLLDRPPEESVRVIALDFLTQADLAHQRLVESADDDRTDARSADAHGTSGHNAADDEALHDFRVAVRRLRSTLRAYAKEVRGAVTKKARRRLRRLAHSTNAGRDLEVQIAWLAAQRAGLYSRHRAGLNWILARLRADKADADAALARELAADFAHARRAFGRSLEHYTRTVRIGGNTPPPRFAGTLAARLRHATAELTHRLVTVASPEQVDDAHAARIAAKRTRYLLEPVVDLLDGGPTVLKQLKRMQEVLGDLHDMDVLRVTLADALADAADERERLLRELADAVATEPFAVEATAPVAVPNDGAAPPVEAPTPAELPADPRPGLLALDRRVVARRDALYADAEQRWFGGHARDTLDALEQVAVALDVRARRGAADLEIERKYLLRSLPHLVRDHPAEELDQGYLPGERLVERLRRARAADGTEHYFRTVKLGRGLSRIEVEEETSRELFDALWPLTEGRRVQKRRYRVPDEDVAWEIDQFVDRTLVLAEVELAHEHASVSLPDWLAQHVVREVTDDAAYTNRMLAR